MKQEGQAGSYFVSCIFCASFFSVQRINNAVIIEENLIRLNAYGYGRTNKVKVSSSVIISELCDPCSTVLVRLL